MAQITGVRRAATTPAARLARGRPHGAQPRIWPYLVPVGLVFAAVYIVPLGYTIWTALHETHYYQVGGFQGLAAFGRLFADQDLPSQVLTTLTFALASLAVALPVGLGSALALNNARRMKRLSRSLLLLPWLLSQATAGTIWLWFLNPNYGPATQITTWLGFGPTDLFSSPGSALAGVVLITAWWSYPQAMLLFLAALQAVPRELVEGLRVDGGNAWHSFRFITLAYLRNTMASVAVVLLMLYVQMVTIILVTTHGGPLIATETLSMRVYNQMFRDYDLSGASATAILLFGVNVVLTVVAIRFRRKELL